MKRVYTADSVAMAWHISNVLQFHGIDTELRNSNLYSVAGELPITECLPEVWVKRPLDFRYAEQLIRELLQGDGQPDSTDKPEAGALSSAPDWLCRECGESNADIFAICWQCQASRYQPDDEV